MTCAPSLFRVFAVDTKKQCILSYLLSNSQYFDETWEIIKMDLFLIICKLYGPRSECFISLTLCILETLANSEDPDEMPKNVEFHQGIHCSQRLIQSSGTELHNYLKVSTCDPLKYI